MTDNQSHDEEEHGEAVEVDEKGEHSALRTKAKERRKLIDDDDDEEEPLSCEVRLQLGVASFIMFLMIFSILFFSWYCFGWAFFKAVKNSRIANVDGAPTMAPTPTPCTRLQEILGYLGFNPAC